MNYERIRRALEHPTWPGVKPLVVPPEWEAVFETLKTAKVTIDDHLAATDGGWVNVTLKLEGHEDFKDGAWVEEDGSLQRGHYCDGRNFEEAVGEVSEASPVDETLSDLGLDILRDRLEAAWKEYMPVADWLGEVADAREQAREEHQANLSA